MPDRGLHHLSRRTHPKLFGDTSTWFRSQAAGFEAITAEVFFHSASGQPHGRDNLAAHRRRSTGEGPKT